jgi:hypothetical protein
MTECRIGLTTASDRVRPFQEQQSGLAGPAKRQPLLGIMATCDYKLPLGKKKNGGAPGSLERGRNPAPRSPLAPLETVPREGFVIHGATRRNQIWTSPIEFEASIRNVGIFVSLCWFGCRTAPDDGVEIFSAVFVQSPDSEGRHIMISGMTTFTFVHVVLSLVGIVTGLIVLLGPLGGKGLDGWTS